MKIIKYIKAGDCLESSNAWDFLLDREMDEDFLDILEKHGKLVAHRGSGKPYFRLITKGKYTIKGSLGNRTFRALLAGEDDRYVEEILEMVQGGK